MVQATAERALPLLFTPRSGAGVESSLPAVFFAVDIVCGIRGWQFDEPKGMIVAAAGGGLLQLRTAVRASGEAILETDFSVSASPFSDGQGHCALAGPPEPITSVESLVDEIERQATRVTMRHSAYADEAVA